MLRLYVIIYTTVQVQFLHLPRKQLLINDELGITVSEKGILSLNIGVLDRILRLSAGLGVVFFDYISNSAWEIVFLIFGVWSVTTSVFGWCPFYRVLGVNTCPASFQLKQDTRLDS